MSDSFQLGVFKITCDVKAFQGPHQKGAVLAQALQACIDQILEPTEAAQLLRGVQGDKQHGARPYALWCNDTRERINHGQLTWTMVLGEPREFWSGEWYCALPEIWAGMCQDFVKPANRLSFSEASLVDPWEGFRQRVAWLSGLSGQKMQVEPDLRLLLTEEMLLDTAGRFGAPHEVMLEFTTPLALSHGNRVERDDLLAALLSRPREFFRACGVAHNFPWMEGIRFSDYFAEFSGRMVELIPGERRGLGFLGTVTLRGKELKRLLPLLFLCQVLGVGKQTTKGFGRFRLTTRI